MAKYTEFDQKRAFMLFMDDTSISEISRLMNISRQTLDTWSKRGWPEALSGGMDWKSFRTKNRADVQTRAIVKQSVRLQESSLDFLDTAKSDVKDLFDSLREQLFSKGADKANYGDIEKLLNIFIRLDNQGAEKILWQQNALRQIFTVVLNRVKDERIVLQIKNDMIGLAAAEQKKLGDMPGKEFLPTPVDMVVEDSDTLLLLDKIDSVSSPDTP